MEELLLIDRIKTIKCCETPITRSFAYILVKPFTQSKIYDFLRINVLFKSLKVCICSNCGQYHILSNSRIKVYIIELISRYIPSKNIYTEYIKLGDVDKRYLEELTNNKTASTA